VLSRRQQLYGCQLIVLNNYGKLQHCDTLACAAVVHAELSCIISFK
jgi:hypothetical protein